jgi:cation transport regulator ChaC
VNDEQRWSYFAYGSNMDPVQMAERCPGSAPLEVACLRDHRLAYTYDSSKWRGGVATVIPAVGERVWGVVWELTAEHIAALDRYELVHRDVYRRDLVDVFAADRALPAFVYITNDSTPRLPNRRYVDALVRGATHFELPPDYIATLRATPTA